MNVVHVTKEKQARLSHLLPTRKYRSSCSLSLRNTSYFHQSNRRLIRHWRRLITLLRSLTANGFEFATSSITKSKQLIKLSFYNASAQRNQKQQVLWQAFIENHKAASSLTCSTGASDACVVGGQVLHFFGSFLCASKEMNKKPECLHSFGTFLLQERQERKVHTRREQRSRFSCLQTKK